MEMRRRGFLAGLLALPFVGPLTRAARAVKRKLWPTIYVGNLPGASHATLASALRDIEPGGTIYLMPGHAETIREPLVIDKPGLSFVGAPEQPARFIYSPDDDA